MNPSHSSSPAATRKPLSLVQIVFATSAGNALEWFDIAIYGFFAIYIGKHFFPTSNQTASLLLTFGTFGASYLVRPIGGVVLGAYADGRGRKAALMMSVSLMMVGTAIIALMPSYSTIGLAAPIGVFAARLIQGFSAGGEFGASTAMLIEHAPHRRGFLASWQFATQGLSTLMAATCGFALSRWLSHEALDAWGWRVPFFLGLLIGPVGLYLRRFLEDAADFTEAVRTETPVRDVFATQKRMMLVATGAVHHAFQRHRTAERDGSRKRRESVQRCRIVAAQHRLDANAACRATQIEQLPHGRPALEQGDGIGLQIGQRERCVRRKRMVDAKQGAHRHLDRIRHLERRRIAA